LLGARSPVFGQCRRMLWFIFILQSHLLNYRLPIFSFKSYYIFRNSYLINRMKIVSISACKHTPTSTPLYYQREMCKFWRLASLCWLPMGHLSMRCWQKIWVISLTSDNLRSFQSFLFFKQKCFL
jgi:hypothetical protein